MTALPLGFPKNGTKPLKDCDDEEDEGPGRILTLEEFMERLRDRPDIFGVERNTRLRNTEVLALVVALLAGLWTVSREQTTKTHSDFYGRMPSGVKETTVTIRTDGPLSLTAAKEVPKPAASSDGRKTIRPHKPATSQQSGTRVNGGSGNPYAHVARQGVLGFLATHTRGIDVAGDLFGQGGFTRGIDAIISGKAGLNRGGMNSVGRKGLVGMGFGPGFGPSGFDGPGPGGIDDLMSGLMGSQVPDIELKPKTGPPGGLGKLRTYIDPKGSGFIGNGRSRSEILRVVNQNLAALRYAYNKRLREKPGLKGKITIRFAIDEFGNVIHCDVIESSMHDDALESMVTGKIARWKFDKIDKPGDVTEVIYPFVFST
jgi:hypothetical protein